MKILMVTMSMGIGGAETHILELSKGLCARGIEVHVASAGGVFVEELEKAGVLHETLPLDRREVFSMMRAESGLAKLIGRERYDIVHAHARIPAFICGRLREKMDFRFVTTDHLDFELTPLLKKLTNWGEWTFAVSRDLKNYLLEHFDLNPRHISLTVNGVDTEKFSPDVKMMQKENSDADGRAVILHISRLDAPVTVCASALMEAMLLLDGKCRLVIVGDGDHAGALRIRGNEINEMLGYDAVSFAGAQRDVRPYIAGADIVVSPSRAAMEGMAFAKPVIVSGSQGHGGIFSEKIKEEAIKSNFCFRGASLPTAERLASEIREILAMSAEERVRLGAFCRACIQEHYSVDRMVESQLSVYRELSQYPLAGEPDIILCGYYGYGNLGDESLLSVIIRELRNRDPGVRICVLSAHPKKTASFHMVDAIHRFDLVGIRRKMKKAKLFLFGGGSLLQDKTSNRSLSYYIHMLRMAKKSGAKIAVFANGVGPVLREKNRARVGDALSLADTLSFRDVSSLRFCRKHCPEKNPRLVFDPVILETNADVNVKKENFFVVIPKKTTADGEKCLKRAILRTITEKGFHPVFLSLFAAEDGEYAKGLAHEFGAEYVLCREAETCVSYLSRARFLVSSRLHGLVYATAAGCPMIAFTDDVKLLSYMETIGLGEGDEFPLACKDSDGEARLSNCVDLLMANESEIRGHLLERLPIWRAMAEAEIGEIARLLI